MNRILDLPLLDPHASFGGLFGLFGGVVFAPPVGEDGIVPFYWARKQAGASECRLAENQKEPHS
jgi:hypothetical protein